MRKIDLFQCLKELQFTTTNITVAVAVSRMVQHNYNLRDRKTGHLALKPKVTVSKKQRVHLPAQLTISATATKNWFFKDTVLDFFSHIRRSRIQSQQIKTIKPLPESFKSTILQNGITFETEAIKFLRDSLGHEHFKTICVDYRLAKSSVMYNETIAAMQQGVPIIYQGVVHNYTDNTYGVPDLLVRHDWIHRLVNHPHPENEVVEEAPAPGLGTNWHYRVVDIKCSTLNFASNGINLINSGSIPSYKGQLCIYNNALTEMQGYNPGKSYILGKRWSHTKTVQGTKISKNCNNCFDKLGIIDYSGYDSSFVTETNNAVAWLKNVETNGDNWQLFPPTNDHLYPNMKNDYDYPYHQEKKELAEQIGEITSIWYCGTKNRKLALEAGITSWRDPRCTAEILGHHGKTANTVNTILNVNRSNEQPIYIDRSFLDTGLHLEPTGIEFFVDYETISNVVDQPTIPYSQEYNMIYMIGVGYLRPDTTGDFASRWVYRDFTVANCTPAEETRIISEWITYMHQVAGEPLGRPLQAPVYHWSHIEQTMFESKQSTNNVLKRFNITGWTDLCKIFTDCPIVPKGALSFGLKEIAKAMYESKLIQSYWNTANPCNNGLESMVVFKKIRDNATAEGKDIRQVPLLKDILDYNELDCKVMCEILFFLRREAQIVLLSMTQTTQIDSKKRKTDY